MSAAGEPISAIKSPPAALVIRTFDSHYRDAFARLNYAWINKYFGVEEPDRQILDHPESAIVKTGGQIFFALDGESVVGTVALKRDDDSTFELTKMAVDETVRGRGIGRALLSAAIGYARQHGATRMVLSSHTSLVPAIAMYRSVGFVERKDDQTSCYARCNIYMELDLRSKATQSAKVIVAPYAPMDRQAVAALILTIQRDEFSIPITLQDQPDLLDIPNFYQHGKGNFWLARVGDEIVGTIALLDIGSCQGALRKMFVKQEYRGSEFRVAQRLLEVLCTWCAEREVREVFLGTIDKFKAAQRFYEKNGFLELQKSELPATFPIMAVDNRFYARTFPTSGDRG